MKHPKKKTPAPPPLYDAPQEMAGMNMCAIREPLLLDSARELRRYVAELRLVIDEINAKLFDRHQQSLTAAPCNDLETIIKDTCTEAACLVGAARTISSRLSD